TVTANDLSSPGFVTYSGSIGSFMVSADLGTGFPDIGSPAYPVLDLTSLDLTSDKGGTLTVSLTETGFATTSAGVTFLSSLVGNYHNSHATLDTYLDTSDAPFGKGTPLSSGLLDNQADTSSLPPISGPYSLTEIITVTAGAASLTSLDAIVEAPEPTALSVLGVGLVALAFFGVRRLQAVRRSVPAIA
ncbi:MAG TPA: hypothetical protein VFQ82_15465, partial [Stellaceae bacterium]|nr:hypothetical protein [Stellaceae bacterium]